MKSFVIAVSSDLPRRSFWLIFITRWSVLRGICNVFVDVSHTTKVVLCSHWRSSLGASKSVRGRESPRIQWDK